MSNFPPDSRPVPTEELIDLCYRAAKLTRPTQNESYLINNVVPLMVLTCITESRAKWRRQLGFRSDTTGGAFSIFQMEAAAVGENLSRLREIAPKIIPEGNVFTHLQHKDGDFLAACLCSLYYLPKKGTIPDNPAGQAEYWKKHYNTVKGAGIPSLAVEHYIRALGWLNPNKVINDQLRQA